MSTRDPRISLQAVMTATWDQVLTPYGWTRARTLDADTTAWTRPGASAGAISATTGPRGLYVLAHAGTPFQTGRYYGPELAAALLKQDS